MNRPLIVESDRPQIEDRMRWKRENYRVSRLALLKVIMVKAIPKPATAQFMAGYLTSAELVWLWKLELEELFEHELYRPPVIGHHSVRDSDRSPFVD